MTVARSAPSTLANARVRAIVALVDEIRRWLPEPDATSHQAIVVIVAEYAASLVDPIFGDRFDPVTAS
jgi:hypothetical protein